MSQDPVKELNPEAVGTCLRVYLLGQVELPAMLNLQRALVYQVQEERQGGALVLCEHPPLITVGREGRPADIRYEPEELRARRWDVRWVNRGGGCWLHLPGQLAVYAVLALDHFRLGVESYVRRLQQVVVRLLLDFRIAAAVRPGEPGVWVGPRAIAEVGVAVRDWVSYYGFVLNVHPDLVPYRNLGGRSPADEPMTSVERERRGPLRPAFVRELLLEHFGELFPFERTAVFSDHPLLVPRAPAVRRYAATR